MAIILSIDVRELSNSISRENETLTQGSCYKNFYKATIRMLVCSMLEAGQSQTARGLTEWIVNAHGFNRVNIHTAR